MRFRLRLPAVSAAFLLATRMARADDDVVVRGTQVGGFVSRASMDDASREVTDVASLVEPMPGVHVRRLGADDAFSTLSIRGSSSTQVAVYLAGVPLTGGADPTVDLATLPLWPGARAQVHRSFSPAALGRGSLGGTLEIDGVSPRAPERTDVFLAGGSFGERRLRIGNVAEVGGGVRVASGFAASRSDDDFGFLDPIPALTGNDVFVTRQNAGHAAVSGLASVAIPVSLSHTRGSLTLTNLAQARRQELPGSARFLTPKQRIDSSRLVSGVELTLPAGRGTFGARAWGRREELALRDDPRVVLSPVANDDVVVATGGSLGWKATNDRSSVELRIDASGERYAPQEWVGVASPPGATRTSAGLALDSSHRLTEGGLTVGASGRADLWSDAGPSSSAEGRPTGNLGVELPLGPVVAAAHGGFVARPPSFVERYGNRGAFIGTPDLETESAFVTDLGARVAERVGPLELSASLAGFGTWAENLITFVVLTNGRAKATNIGRARVLGLESELRAKVNVESAGTFELRGAHTALATTNEAQCTGTASCERPPLPGRPENDLVADLAWQKGPVRLRYGIDVMSGMRADEKGDIAIPARVLHGAGIRVSPRRDLVLALDARNLFDLRVADYPGPLGNTVHAPIGDLYDYPLPGRRILLSATFSR